MRFDCPSKFWRALDILKTTDSHQMIVRCQPKHFHCGKVCILRLSYQLISQEIALQKWINSSGKCFIFCLHFKISGDIDPHIFVGLIRVRNHETYRIVCGQNIGKKYLNGEIFGKKVIHGVIVAYTKLSLFRHFRPRKLPLLLKR